MLDRVLTYGLLAVLCARPFIGETFEPLQLSFLEALHSPSGPTPAATAALDAVQLALAGVLLARSRGRLHPLVGAGLALLVLAVALSSARAGDRVVALRAGMNLVSLAAAALALYVTLPRSGLLPLALAGMLATGIATAVKCHNQRFVENPNMRTAWEQTYKPELLRQGFAPDDPLFVNFERRMHAGEAYGFQGHPNVTGGMLALWALAVGGLAAALHACAAARWPALVAWLLVAVMLGGLWFTGSLGGVIAVGLGAGVLILLSIAGRAGTRWRPGRVLAVLALAYAALVGGGLGLGVARGTLPHASLAFRWQYWTAAAQVYREAPLTGVGRENFARPYLRYKNAASAEEVKSPHNLWVGLAVELGPAGLLAGLLLSGAALYAALRRWHTAGPAEGGESLPLTLARAAPLALGVLLVHAVTCGEDFARPGVAIVWVQEIALAWCIGLAIATWLLNARDRAAAPWLAAGLFAGLCAMLVHGLIDFVLLTPAGLAAFALAVDCTARPLAGTAERRTTWRVATGLVLTGAAVAVQFVLVLRPAVAAESLTRGLRAALAAPPADAGRLLEYEVARVWNATWDAGSARFAARVALQYAQAPGLDGLTRVRWLNRAIVLADLAEGRAPGVLNTAVMQAQIAEQRVRLLEASDSVEAVAAQRAAAANWETAVARHPTDPRLRISAATAYLGLVNHGEAAARVAARRHLEEALAIDAQRAPGDATRLRPAERKFIADALGEVASEPRPPGG